MSYLRSMMIAAVAAFATAACESDVGTPMMSDSTPASITAAVSDTLHASVATSVPFTVTVLNAGHNPVRGGTVEFSVVSGNGSLAATSVQTDNLGQASTTWTLGTKTGPQAVTATIGGLAPVVLNAITTPGTAITLDIAGGANQTAVAGTAVASDPSVKAFDAYGNAVPNAMVLFQARNGGSVNGRTDGNAAPVFTNADGVATVHWILGPSTGADSLLARLDGTVTPTVIFADAIAPQP